MDEWIVLKCFKLHMLNTRQKKRTWIMNEYVVMILPCSMDKVLSTFKMNDATLYNQEWMKDLSLIYSLDAWS